MINMRADKRYICRLELCFPGAGESYIYSLREQYGVRKVFPKDMYHEPYKEGTYCLINMDQGIGRIIIAEERMW